MAQCVLPLAQVNIRQNLKNLTIIGLCLGSDDCVLISIYIGLELAVSNFKQQISLIMYHWYDLRLFRSQNAILFSINKCCLCAKQHGTMTIICYIMFVSYWFSYSLIYKNFPPMFLNYFLFDLCLNHNIIDLKSWNF